MGFSPRTTEPPIRNTRLRDYRTLSLPAVTPRTRRDGFDGDGPDVDANWMGEDAQSSCAARAADGARVKYLEDAGPGEWRSASGTWRAAPGATRTRRTLAPRPMPARSTHAPATGAAGRGIDQSAVAGYEADYAHEYSHEYGHDPMRHERRTGAVPATPAPASPTRSSDRTATASTRAVTVIGGRTTRARVPAIATRPAMTAVRAAPLRTDTLRTDTTPASPRRKGPPIWLLANLAILLMVGAGIVTPRLLSADASAACQWYTVRPGDTLGNIGWQHHTNAMALARANHIVDPNLIFVGQRLCVPMAWFAQASSAPVAPKHSVLAAAYVAPQTGAHGLPAGEPCTQDRSIVWTVPVSRWAIPPGCFSRVYYPNPYNYLVHGKVIPGFGWCNWWPEALLRNPLAYMLPGHRTPRVGVMVFWAPQPGERTGHYGYVESIGTGKNAGWILISEMNMYWRGAGWAKVDYRYIRVNYPGATYLY